MRKTKEAQLNVKVSPEAKEEYAQIAEEYGMSLSDWVRYSIDYIAKNKPALGKSFAPREQSLIAANS